MAPRDLPGVLEDDYETELSRLGSSKAIYALSHGDMDATAVRSAIASQSAQAADIFGEWADTDEVTDAASFFEALSSTEHDRATQLIEQTDASPNSTDTAVHAYLRDLTTSHDRMAAAIAWLVIQDRTYSQTIGFFVGSAERDAADQFRAYRDQIAEHLESARALIDLVCESDDEWDDAQQTAGNVITAAYDTYATTLEEMGIKVKPIC